MSDTLSISPLTLLIVAFQLSLGFIFLVSTLPKLRRPLDFARTVVEYRILPPGVAYIVGLAVIPAEAFLAIAFLTGVFGDIALLIALAMLSAFSVAVGINLRRGRKISCGCFGKTGEKLSPRTLARLLLLLSVVALLLVSTGLRNAPMPTPQSIITNTSSPIYLLEAAFLAFFLLVLGALILTLPELTLLFRQSPRPPSRNVKR